MLKHALLPFVALALTAQTPATEAHHAKPHAAVKPAATPAPETDKVLAWIGKTPLKQSDFDLFIELAVPPQQRSMLAMVPSMKQQYLRQFLDLNLLAAKARHEKLDKTKAYRDKLAMRERETLAVELIQTKSAAFQSEINVSDEAVKAYYESHKADYSKPETYTVRHILIGSKNPQDKESKGLDEAEAKAKALKVLAELKTGKKIGDLAKEYSDDPGSKDKGGLYENVPYGKFVPEFEAAVKTLQPGQLSEPVKTHYGYHIIELESRNPGELTPLDKVKDKVKQDCTYAQQEAVYNKFIDETKKELGYKEEVPVPPAASRNRRRPAVRGAK
nr:peptidylprolyl isomerase [uncultured Holophaga sp.]